MRAHGLDDGTEGLDHNQLDNFEHQPTNTYFILSSTNRKSIITAFIS